MFVEVKSFINPCFITTMFAVDIKHFFFEFFIKAGIIQIKDVLYAEKPGFLSSDAIKKIVWNNDPNIPSHLIENAYIIIRHAIPLEWYQYINNNIYDSKQAIQLNLYIQQKSKVFLVKECKTHIFYKIMKSYIFQLPNFQILLGKIISGF